MPVIKIDMWEGHDTETKRRLIQAVSNAVSETLSIPNDWVQIIITDVSKDNWGLKGDQASQVV